MVSKLRSLGLVTALVLVAAGAVYQIAPASWPLPGASGYVLTSNGTGRSPSWQASAGGASYVKSAQYATADQLTASGTFATTYAIPANTLKAGSVIEVWGAGPFNVTTGEFLKVGVTLGSTAALPTVGQFLSPSAGNWNLVGRCVVVTAGATGTAECEGHIIEGSGSSAPGTSSIAANTTFALDTTASKAVSIPAILTSGNGTANLSQLLVVIFP